jgi:hypothetical protein
MPGATPQILSPAELARLATDQPENPATRRERWAFNRGGGFDLVTSRDGTVVAVVPDPAKVTDEQRAEIAAAGAELLARRAAIAGDAAPAPTPSPAAPAAAPAPALAPAPSPSAESTPVQ